MNAWIPRTSLPEFYAQTLASYPFPKLLKPLLVAFYVGGAIYIARNDRRFLSMLLIFLVIGPIIIAIVSIVKPMYLTRSIAAFATLSPILIGAALAALPSTVGITAGAALMLIHLYALTPDYPISRGAPFVERFQPVLATLSSSSKIFYDSSLVSQLDAYRVPHADWRAIVVEDSAMAIPAIRERLTICSEEKAGCGRTVVIMASAPMWFRREGRAWMAQLGALEKEFSVIEDQDLSGERVIVFR